MTQASVIMLHQYEWKDFVFRDGVTTLRCKFILEVKVRFLKFKQCVHVAPLRTHDSRYSPASAASLAQHLPSFQLLFSYPCSHELGCGSRDVLDVTIIREHSVGMVICIPFSLGAPLIFCLSNTLPSLNLNASLCLLCTTRGELPQKVSLISAPEHERERFKGGLLAKKTEEKVWESEKISGQVLYSGRLPFHIDGVNNFLHLLSHVVTFLIAERIF